MFQLAIRRGLPERMPLFPKRLEENPPRDGFFEHHEYVKVRAHLPRSYRDVLDFAYYSGWRRNEILGLTWDEVDLTGGVIRLTPRRSKTKTGRVLPISPPLQAARDEIAAKAACSSRVAAHVESASRSDQPRGVAQNALISTHRANIAALSVDERYEQDLADPSIFYQMPMKNGEASATTTAKCNHGRARPLSFDTPADNHAVGSARVAKTVTHDVKEAQIKPGLEYALRERRSALVHRVRTLNTCAATAGRPISLRPDRVLIRAWEGGQGFPDGVVNVLSARDSNRSPKR